MVVINESETIDDDLFVGAESIDLSGTVNGSVFAGASIADIKGTIKGDLVLGVGNANISASINGDLYVGAGDVVLSKTTVGGNVIVGSGNLMIDSSSKIGGSLIAGAGSVKNGAEIGRNAMIGAGSIYFDSKVGKEARLGGSNIQLGPNTYITKDLTYALEDDDSTLMQDPSASIAGSLTRYTPPINASREIAKSREDARRFAMMAGRGMLVMSFFGLLLIGLLATYLFPNTSLGITKQVNEKLGKSLGIGFLIVVSMLPILFILALTIVGLPLAGLLLLVFWASLTLAKVFASYSLGRFVVRQFNLQNWGKYAVFAVGLVIFYILRAVPGIGIIASILFTWVGLGGMWLYGRSHLKNL